MKLAARYALVAGLAAAAGPVFADAYSTASFGNVTVTLIDLDPNDGIAASISFLPNTTKFDGGAYIHGEAEDGIIGGYDPGHQLQRFDKSGAWQSTNVSGNAHTGLSSAAASVTGSASGVGFTALSVSGKALSGLDDHGNYYSYASVPFNNVDNRGFVLSANTKVVFSVDAAMSATMTRGYTAGALEGESASALMSLYAGGLAADGSMLDDLQQHGVGVQYFDGGPLGGATDSWAGVMSASYSNLTNHSSQGQFWADAQVGGHSVMAAVPEPETYAMLLGGLGLLGGLARRRNRTV
ncbi:PEP-CTERM sorting domain-containing protein [Duganella callida]|uniref:PEP-CTERM sorting domain-containing protein n=1 Tax=Duganella callida TaxID=2561932 RepID=UPI001E3FCEF5|nr:PEP-CTERM sorting domain-containing protein [Duganella callida]